MILQVSQFFATLSTTLFYGAAIYINVAEHPSRTDLDNRSAAAQWAASHQRATWMQAPPAILGFLAGIGSWIIGGGLLWLIAAFKRLTNIIWSQTTICRQETLVRRRREDQREWYYRSNKSAGVRSTLCERYQAQLQRFSCSGRCSMTMMLSRFAYAF